jgi:UDP-GlcNAc:undecaprenyl-phosphate/decaprenyl-phosphate GlcNAc-1-phosphate transferase
MLSSFNAMEIGGVLASLALAIVLLSLAQPLGTRLGVIDMPDTQRKRHARPTPLIGGIAMIVPLLIWTALGLVFPAMSDGAPIPLAVLVCGGGAALIGFLDDRAPYSPTIRFVALLLLSALALYLSPQLLPSQFHWGHLASSPVAPWASIILVAIGTTGFVNSVNMADGQDGCVAGMFVIWAACVILAGNDSVADIAAILFVTGLAVLAFNLAGKVFLGGAGAYGVTFVFGLLILDLHNNWGVTAETIIVWLFLPIVDCLRLLISRPLHGHSPFQGDRNHFHHRLQERFGKHAALAIYLGLVALFAVTATLKPDLAPLCLAVLACAYAALMWLTSASAIHARRPV